VPQKVNWNETTPATPAGKQVVHFLADAPSADPSIIRNASAYVDGIVRANFVITTASLAVNAEEHGSKVIGKTISVIKVQVNDNARIRLYSTAAQRDADASRAIGTAPVAGSSHGLIGEWVLNGTVGLSFIASPEAIGSNADSSVSGNIYYNIQNMGAGSQIMTVTLTCAVQEA
jgi:hypothetical protein